VEGEPALRHDVEGGRANGARVGYPRADRVVLQFYLRRTSEGTLDPYLRVGEHIEYKWRLFRHRETWHRSVTSQLSTSDERRMIIHRYARVER
jgi:hypothetical protein